MKSTLYLLLLMVGATGALCAQNADIQVTVNGIEAANQGPVVFMLFSSSDGFPTDPAKARQIGQVTGYTSSATYTFSGVPAGRYAVAVFQDKNANRVADTNFLGIPKEPVGAYQHASFGRPNFSKCSFTHGPNDAKLQLQLLNQ
ncbi:MAG: DUF2141 domain-containing protein [Bacteroidota bacterium]